jgi:dihydrofolate reductase
VTTTRDLPPPTINSSASSSIKKSVEFYSGDLKRLVDGILAPRYRNVWLVGGAMLCQDFLRLGLVDEIRLSIVPVLLDDGLRLFENSGAEPGVVERWHLKNVAAYKNGFVELLYGKGSTKSQP